VLCLFGRAQAYVDTPLLDSKVKGREKAKGFTNNKVLMAVEQEGCNAPKYTVALVHY